MHTPHNMGFAVVDRLAERFDLRLRRSFRFRARMAGGSLDGIPAALAEPTAYMNLSGPVVASIMRRRGFSAESLLVVADDVNLPEGQLRIRPRGSSGGHKGLQSVIDSLGHDNFARLRLGVGGAGAADLAGHVLAPFASEAAALIENMITRAVEAVMFLLKNGVEAAMNAFNKPIRKEIL